MSSESDSDEIEIDGFPPESANNARFTSLKSMNEKKLYLPINSFSFEAPSNEMIKSCFNALKYPSKMSFDERKTLLEQLELYLGNTSELQSTEPIWHSKASPLRPKSPNKKAEISKSSSFKINIEIPSSCPNPNNIKYSIDQPIFDNENGCWKTGMDFILQNSNSTIFECDGEVNKDSKSTQTELSIDSIRDSFLLLPKPIGYDSRSRSEEKLMYPGVINLDSLTTRLSADNEFSFLEEFEETLQDFKISQRNCNFKTSFRKYKSGVQKSLDKHIQSLRRLKSECEAIITFSYDKLTESQFKRHSQNQLLLIDVEQEINFLNADVNRKDLKFEKITRLKSNFPGTLEIESEVRKTRFVKALRLISQMISTLKTQISILTVELKNNQKQNSILDITI